MNILLFSGIAATALAMTAGPAGAADSVAAGSRSELAQTLLPSADARKPAHNVRPGAGMRHGPRPGFHGIPRNDVYRRPHRGFIIPRYWAQPVFYVTNFRRHGLSAPSAGYNWSRYHDDAVMIDSRGYVQDYRSDIDWDSGYSAGDDGYDRGDHGAHMRPDDEAYGWNDRGAVSFAAPDGSRFSYDGEWRGEFIDPEARIFEGEWQGRVTRHGSANGVDHGNGGHAQAYRHHSDWGSWQGGHHYYANAPMVTTIVINSGVTTTVTEEISYETVRTAPRKRIIRKWKPKPKPRCVCR